MITVLPATATDFATIRSIAYETWPIAYGEILSKAQLDYMLGAFYNDTALKGTCVAKEASFCIGK